MNFWKKFGWFMLSLTPAIAVLCWQFLVSGVGMFIYSAYRSGLAVSQGLDINSMTKEEFNIFTDSIIADFLSGTPYNIVMLVVYIGYLILFGLWFWLMFCRKKQTGDWKQVKKPWRILGIVGSGIALQVAVSMALTVILPLLPELMESYAEVMNSLIGSDSVLIIICVCLLAPIGEELIFRGLTFRIMRKAVPWQAALVIQALLFGVYHLNLVQGIYAMLLGLVFGYIAYRYGSVVPGILLHMVINSSSYLLDYLLPESLQEQPVMMILLGVAALAAAVGFTYLVTKNVKATDINATDVQSIPTN